MNMRLLIFAALFMPALIGAMERPSAMDPKLQKKFIEAVESNNVNEVNRLLKYRPRININLPDGHGVLPIVTAVQNNNVEIVRALLEAGADPDQLMFNTLTPGYTLLMGAASQGNAKLVKVLLDFDADPYLRAIVNFEIQGRTALEIAKDKAVIELLKSYSKTKLP